ncbi:MAG: hypothetical protein PUB18_00915 [bacterium]|nr:hypothetical protein [bacterium]
MKKAIFLLLILCLLLTGCTTYTELNDLGIVSLLGIDYQDHNYIVYVSIMEGNQDDGVLEKDNISYHAEAQSLEEAFQNIIIQSSKKVYLSHIDVLLLTDQLINTKLKETLLNFLNNNEYRNNFNIVSVSSPLASFFESEIKTDEIEKLISINHQESGTTQTIDFETFFKNLLIDQNSYLPRISLEEEHLIIDGFTLKKDYQKYQTLNQEESILLNLLNNQITHAVWKNITIYENETTIKINQNKVTITLNITTDDKQKLNQKLKSHIETFWSNYQKQNYDLLKLQYKIYQNDFSYYKTQHNLLQKIKLEIKLNIKQKNNYIGEIS